MNETDQSNIGEVMTTGEHTLLVLLRAWLAHRRSGWTHKRAKFDCLCEFAGQSYKVFVGVSGKDAYSAVLRLHGLLIRDFGTGVRPFKKSDGHVNPARVAWVRKIIKELEGEQ